VAHLSEITAPGVDSVVGGTLRTRERLAVRAGDLFIASAWWSAHLARDLMRQQIEHFGSAPAKFVYLIQDYECGFYPWSTSYMLAENTYHNPEQIIPIFNTELLASFFRDRGYFADGITYNPPMNERISAKLEFDKPRQKIVLIYMRPHAVRNCLEFAEQMVECAVANDPQFWRDWSFYAVGENFLHDAHLRSRHITILGRLTLDRYAELLGVASAGLSLMVSPHPSYPPLEMAAAGIPTLVNTYEKKDLSLLHDNLHSFTEFDPQTVAQQLRQLAADGYERNAGRDGKPKINWFFGGKSNLDEAVERASAEVTAVLRVLPRALPRRAGVDVAVGAAMRGP
jgi:hypothetical protein